MNRRSFVAWAAAAVVGTAALGWGAAEWASFEARLARAKARAQAYFADHDRTAVVAVGAAWLSQVAPSRDDAALRAAFAAVLPDLDDSVASLHERVHTDFRDLRTVAVQGWTLSLTEVCLAALVELGD